ncbi:uncharacterized protein LOC129918107 [Episyrphus balteatus]|uniref:uncharacterized protein LOC129918107 n=1 Tax=Episyrphus balteatus TaxID=286459 RepID=UPI002484FE7F|nr:uncharacterized protein LOC129918107 [Episyrphus balteatus]
MGDLQGNTLPILFGGIQMLFSLSKKPNGETVIGGMLGHLFHAFAKRHNATLNLSNANNTLSPHDIHECVLNGSVEISGTGLVLVQAPMQWFSYPYAIFDWGVMLPVEQNIPIYKVFALVFHWKAFVITVVLLILLSILLTVATKLSGSQRTFYFNIDSFRGILGQPFSETPRTSLTSKIIYFQIFLLGIIIVTSYDAFLQSFMTKPLKGKIIKSFDDLQQSGLKIYTLQADMDELFYKLSPTIKEKYSNLFLGEKNFATFVSFRDSLNTKYAYTLPQPRWKIYENQQNFYGRKLFRWSEDLCFVENFFAGISINENSIYKNILNFHILETQSSGLFDFWMKRTFYELMAIEKIQKLNFGFEPKLQSLKVEDLKWVWLFLEYALMIASLCFLCEIIVFKRNNWRAKMKAIFKI